MQQRERSPCAGSRPAVPPRLPSAGLFRQPTLAHAFLLLDLAFSGMMLFRLVLGTIFAILSSVFFSWRPGETWFQAVTFFQPALAAAWALAIVVDVQGLRGNPRWLGLAFPALVLWGIGQVGGIFSSRADRFSELVPRDPDLTAGMLLAFVIAAVFNTLWLMAVLQLRRRFQRAATWERTEAAPDSRQPPPPTSPTEEGR